MKQRSKASSKIQSIQGQSPLPPSPSYTKARNSTCHVSLILRVALFLLLFITFLTVVILPRYFDYTTNADKNEIANEISNWTTERSDQNKNKLQKESNDKVLQEGSIRVPPPPVEFADKNYYEEPEEEQYKLNTNIMETSIMNILNQNLNSTGISIVCSQKNFLQSLKGKKLPPMSGTITCPCGSKTLTSPKYNLNMAKMYGNGQYNMSTIEKCLNLDLPLRNKDPQECWPKMIIMPSFPTNGSGLARLLLQKALQLLVRMDHYQEAKPGTAPMLLYNLLVPGKKLYKVSSPCDPINEDDDTSLPIPLMGKPAIFKSHHTDVHTSALPIQRGEDIGGNVAGVIRLARNPGDQILRNYHRWSNVRCHESKDKNAKEECFRKGAKAVCAAVDNYTKRDWLPFHTFWNKYDAPQIIYHYEHFADADKVVEETKDVVDFLNGITDNYDRQRSSRSQDDHDDMGKRLQGVVNEVKYEHGTLMAELCGKARARKLHMLTKNVTESLGYAFDDEKATWSLP